MRIYRVYIEKDGGKSTRPIGIPTLEDKILQRAVLMLLQPIYEQDFLDCSYGFRPRRFERFGLELNEQKTKLVNFRPTPVRSRSRENNSAAGAGFDFLAFTHFWGRSMKGRWVVKRNTAKGRFSRSLKRVIDCCRHNRHEPIKEQHASLNRRSREACMTWERFGNLLAYYPLPDPRVGKSVYLSVANP